MRSGNCMDSQSKIENNADRASYIISVQVHKFRWRSTQPARVELRTGLTDEGEAMYEGVKFTERGGGGRGGIPERGRLGNLDTIAKLIKGIQLIQCLQLPTPSLMVWGLRSQGSLKGELGVRK